MRLNGINFIAGIIIAIHWFVIFNSQQHVLSCKRLSRLPDYITDKTKKTTLVVYKWHLRNKFRFLECRKCRSLQIDRSPITLSWIEPVNFGLRLAVLKSSRIFSLICSQFVFNLLVLLAEVESSRRHFEVLARGLKAQVLGLGFKACKSSKMFCARLEDSTIF